MKISTAFLFITTPLLASFNQHPSITSRVAAEENEPPAISSLVADAPLDYYVGSNACWRVDRQRGVISALSLIDGSPLWSSDGVVYRSFPSKNDVIQEIPSQNASPFPAAEIFGRVYFFLDDVAARPAFPQTRNVRRDDLLVALDSNAQGRLVWKRRVRDFAPFFPADERRALRFLNDVKPALNDKLVVQIKSEREVKRFALDAATGEARLLENSNACQ